MQTSLHCLKQNMAKLILVIVVLSQVSVVLAQATSAEVITVKKALIQIIDEVQVPAQSEGPLTELLVHEGQVVSEGDTLGKIDDSEMQLELQRAKLQLSIAEHEATNRIPIEAAETKLRINTVLFQRLKQIDINEPKSVSLTEIDQAELAMATAAAELRQAERDVSQTALRRDLAKNAVDVAARKVELRKLKSPLSGEVVATMRHRGEWVKPGDVIMHLVRTDRLRVQGFIDADKVSQDLQGVEVTIESLLKNKKVTCTGNISFVSRIVDPVNREVMVWAEFDNSDGRMRPGVAAEITIKIP
ncbi:Multidrug resistance protein MdtE precursor [Stieleria bergensis]|uniref:Multidrug resistance protein MdtE n=1 Tax=Stieleria bergensis TaxID=2528025 RepID=A0A517SZ70_9BACT|nr:Multidrug resistance protein MdtE precursor [Planctomycetes bacterium SV_7m_r]